MEGLLSTGPTPSSLAYWKSSQSKALAVLLYISLTKKVSELEPELIQIKGYNSSRTERTAPVAVTQEFLANSSGHEVHYVWSSNVNPLKHIDTLYSLIYPSEKSMKLFFHLQC